MADDQTEAPIVWPPDAKSQLIGKNPEAGKYCGQEKGMRQLDGITNSIEKSLKTQTLGDSEGQGNPMDKKCCSP